MLLAVDLVEEASADIRALPRDELREALAHADLAVLLMVLLHLTGDRRWIEEPYRPRRDSRIFAAEDGGLSAEAGEEIRAAALEVLSAPHDPRGKEIDERLLAEMMEACVGEPVGDDYAEMLAEEIGLRRPQPTPPPDGARASSFEVVVVGAGLAGIGMAIELERLGIPYVVLEAEEGPGGTWYRNTYPDCGVDTPNHFYSFSFDPPADWTSYFSKQPEVLAYIERTIERHGLAPRIRCGVEVRGARWREDAQGWEVFIGDEHGQEERIECRSLVAAVGHLSYPKVPAIPGMEGFGGEVFHTARWREDVPLDGRDVAIVGTGASAMQAAPEVAARARSLTIYQRSPQWVTPVPEYRRRVPEGKRWLLTHVPFYSAWYRFGLFWRYADGLHRTLFVDPEWPTPERSINKRNERHRADMTAYMEEQLAGRPDLVEKCVPSYPPYGKRMLVDSGWFETLKRPNVELVTDGIERIEPGGIRAADGRERPCDVAIMATGFETTRLIWPIEVVGREGSLDEFWRGDDLGAYLGMTVPTFPNFFIMLGPHSGLAHGGSAIFHVECQARYIGRCMAAMIERGIGALECRPDRYAEYEARVDEAHSQMVFAHEGMDNWYKNSRGRVVVPSPWRLVDYWRMTREPDLGDYLAEHEREPAVGP